MKPATFSPFLGLALAASVSAETVANVNTPNPVVEEITAEVATPAPVSASVDPELEQKRKEQEALAVENKLEAERLTRETNAMRAEITRLKMERELMAERQAFDAAKRHDVLKKELADVDAERERLSREGELAKTRAEKLANDLKVVQTEAALEITRLQNEIKSIETKEDRAAYANSDPVYLKNPLREDGTLVISDRRIALNGMISTDTADYITERIHYWNNKDRELPIFIVIDSSPGGSVMAGYRILKAMESSDAQVHVVVKSFAASMAAAITTLAHESYAYPNAVLLHHQISSQLLGRLNLTQQREFHEESQRWWKRLGTPVADKMGVSTDEFIKEMYQHSTSGDWSEFAEDAAKLKWVNHIVQGIEETSFTQDPDVKASASAAAAVRKGVYGEQVDDEGRPFMWLPRLEPKDVYFLYNPDGYYRSR
ncbi:MAG: ATP-dependent Clp protease proteolytic subunit [Akkermansiaceae bacterium]|nr:ATP-dependent Clp protease proteolytic subunit [Akkermansiaceae bacterium]